MDDSPCLHLLPDQHEEGLLPDGDDAHYEVDVHLLGLLQWFQFLGCLLDPAGVPLDYQGGLPFEV